MVGFMSNEYKDWMNDGGCCGDCTHNVFLGSQAVCAKDMSLHKKERCRFFEEANAEPGAMKDEKKTGRGHDGHNVLDLPEYEWIMGVPADRLADELDSLLSGSGMGRLREIVLFLARGNPNDSLLFALCDCINKEMSINDYAMVQKCVRKLSKRLRKMKRQNATAT